MAESTPLTLSRAKLTFLCLTLVAVTLPHATRMPIWLSLYCAALLAWRYWGGRRTDPAATRRHWKTPPLLLRIVLVGLGVAGILSYYGTLLGRDAGISLLVVMLALKMTELHGRREVMLVLFLAYFLVITNFLYDQSIPLAAYMFAVVLLITSALVICNLPNDALQLKRHLPYAGGLLLQAAPLMVILFILFPRVPGPIWKLPEDGHAARTGLSDHMSPGNINRLSRSQEIAFRVRFEDTPPERAQLYWRGPVLWDFDGRTWRTLPHPPGRNATVQGLGATNRYTVTLEPHNRLWLFALEMPVKMPTTSRLTADHTLLAGRKITERKRYFIESQLHYRVNPQLQDAARRAALRLPDGFNPQTLRFAHRTRAAVDSDAAYVQQVLAYFRHEPFHYTLNAPLLGKHSVDEFLFSTRAGFCEHYSSSFVFLMRAAGIPARVVTGYLGGYYNPLGDYMIVRQADAHAWAEVWLAQRGWVRVDPTSAVSPARIDAGVQAALPASEAVGGLFHSDNGVVRRLALLWDSLNNDWNQWVLGYGAQRQLQLLSRLPFGISDWRGMAVGLFVLCTIVTALLAWYIWRHYGGRPKTDPAQRLYQRLCAKLARRGLPRQAHEGPLDYAQRAASSLPQDAPALHDIVDLYVRIRYEGQAEPAALRELRRRVRRLRLPKARAA